VAPPVRVWGLLRPRGALLLAWLLLLPVLPLLLLVVSCLRC